MKSSPHRTWPVSEKPWIYYQEWNHALFFHWEIPLEVLRPLVPEDITLDSFDGKYWVSLVAFTMNKVKLRYLPSVSGISDFHEVNVRTYVKHGEKSGVFFLSIEGEKALSNFIARKMSGLPYETSNITRGSKEFLNKNNQSGNWMKASFAVLDQVKTKDELDIWLTERYCLLLKEKGDTFLYEIEHPEWQINNVDFNSREICYKLGDYNLNSSEPRCHYSPGVQVRAWSRERIRNG